MSLLDLEEVSGVRASNISRIERGLSWPTWTTLNALAGALNVSVEDIVGVQLEVKQVKVKNMTVIEAMKVLNNYFKTNKKFF